VASLGSRKPAGTLFPTGWHILILIVFFPPRARRRGGYHFVCKTSNRHGGVMTSVQRPVPRAPVCLLCNLKMRRVFKEHRAAPGNAPRLPSEIFSVWRWCFSSGWFRYVYASPHSQVSEDFHDSLNEMIRLFKVKERWQINPLIDKRQPVSDLNLMILALFLWCTFVEAAVSQFTTWGRCWVTNEYIEFARFNLC